MKQDYSIGKKYSRKKGTFLFTNRPKKKKNYLTNFIQLIKKIKV